MTVILVLIGIGAIALWLIGHAACIEAERLKIENERLRRMNDGQRAAIEELQSQVWFMEDFVKEGA